MTILKAYLDETGEKQVDFAERVETTPATISRLCAGTLKPALDLAHRIEAATGGLVRTETWLGSGESAEAQANAA
jgi:plasmid maintenance system antidote protein VapI